jgi:hypothetical protein
MAAAKKAKAKRLVLTSLLSHGGEPEKEVSQRLKPAL